jgi:hypothetical protein
VLWPHVDHHHVSLLPPSPILLLPQVNDDKLAIMDQEMRAIFDAAILPIMQASGRAVQGQKTPMPYAQGNLPLALVKLATDGQHPNPTPRLPQTVREMVSRATQRPDRLLLVGGFGSSLYLRACLETTFNGTMGELMTPPFAYSAIVEGAVRFLQRPGTIVARISTLTYGVQVGRSRCRRAAGGAIRGCGATAAASCGRAAERQSGAAALTPAAQVMLPWQEGLMPESIRMWHQHYNKWVTRKGFMVAVRRGQAIDVEHVSQHDILPVGARAGGRAGWHALPAWQADEAARSLQLLPRASRHSQVLPAGTAHGRLLWRWGRCAPGTCGLAPQSDA